MLVACGTLASAPPTATEVPASQADIRLSISLDTVYYAVGGETTEEIFNSVSANGPDIEGELVSGLTEAESSYNCEFLDHITYCELQSVDIELRLIVTLPRHSTPQALSDLQLSRWQDFVDRVAVHEQKHVDIYKDGMETLKNKFETYSEEFLDCNSLESSLSSAWKSEMTLIGQEQNAFHLEEEQLFQQLKKPLQVQIDQYETEWNELESKQDSLALEKAALELKIDDLDRLAQSCKEQMDAIQAQYPDLVLPSSTFDEYERLRTEWNRLNNLRNGMIDQVNAIIPQYNRTIEESKRLVEQMNRLVDELNWLH